MYAVLIIRNESVLCRADKYPLNSAKFVYLKGVR
jgi:hypothetical protein